MEAVEGNDIAARGVSRGVSGWVFFVFHLHNALFLLCHLRTAELLLFPGRGIRNNVRTQKVPEKGRIAAA